MSLPKDTQEIIGLYSDGHSMRQIAAIYDVRHQAVAYRLKGCCDTSKPDLSSRNAEIKLDFAAGVDIALIASGFGISPKRVRAICAGIKRPRKQPGCPDCETEHYARGWCKKCYMRWLRNSK